MGRGQPETLTVVVNFGIPRRSFACAISTVWQYHSIKTCVSSIWNLCLLAARTLFVFSFLFVRLTSILLLLLLLCTCRVEDGAKSSRAEPKFSWALQCVHANPILARQLTYDRERSLTRIGTEISSALSAVDPELQPSLAPTLSPSVD